MDIKPIEYDADMDRFYIPVNSRYEIQTKGKGSSFRIANTVTHERNLVGCKYVQAMLEDMAKATHAELMQQQAEITSLREQLEIAKKDGWISVDTALPDYDSVRQKRLRVLVHWKDTGVVFTLWYGKRFGHNKASFFEENDWDESDYGQIDEGDNLLFGDTLTYKNITHWQPLPEPPKE